MSNDSKEKIEKQRLSLIGNYLVQLATAAGTELGKDRKTLYCRALSDLSEAALQYAFEKALKNLGQFIPSIEELRLTAEEYRPVDPLAATRKYLERNDKPTDWVAMGKKNGVTAEEIEEWLQAGKDKQLELIGKLEDDPEWRAMAARLGGFPSAAGNALERAAAERNGKSEVPADPEAREEWRRELVAKRKADPGYYESGAKR